MTTRVMHVLPSGDFGLLPQFALLAQGLDADEFQLCAVPVGDGGRRQPGTQLLASLAQRRTLEVRPVTLRSGFDPRGLLAMKQIVDSFAPHVVHAFGRRAARCADSACRAAGIRRLVLSDLGSATRAWWDRFLDRLVAGRALRIVVAADAARKRYAALGGAIDKLRVIPWGVAPQDADPRDRAALLETLGLPSGTRLIGSAGPLQTQQRVKDLIWAADLLKCVRDDAHLLVFGAGPQQWRLERYRRQVEIVDRVHFLEAGVAPPPLGALDCFWLAASGEDLSPQLLDAMAGGVPVVAANTATNRAFIHPGENGYLVPIGDRAAFARRTNVLLDDGELARRIGEAGRTTVREWFTVEKLVERHAALYRELVA